MSVDTVPELYYTDGSDTYYYSMSAEIDLTTTGQNKTMNIYNYFETDPIDNRIRYREIGHLEYRIGKLDTVQNCNSKNDYNYCKPGYNDNVIAIFMKNGDNYYLEEDDTFCQPLSIPTDQLKKEMNDYLSVIKKEDKFSPSVKVDDRSKNFSNIL